MNIDVVFIIGLGLYGASVFRDRAYFGWCLASMFLYAFAKIPPALLLLYCLHGWVFPLPDDPYVHLPSGIFAVVVVGLIYYRCSQKRKLGTT